MPSQLRFPLAEYRNNVSTKIFRDTPPVPAAPSGVQDRAESAPSGATGDVELPEYPPTHLRPPNRHSGLPGDARGEPEVIGGERIRGVKGSTRVPGVHPDEWRDKIDKVQRREMSKAY